MANRKGLIEEADGGTFFFDEIAETTPAFQAKLLRVLQEGEIRRVGENRPIKVDIRIVAATNQNIQHRREALQAGILYYRLNVVRFMLPPRGDGRTSRSSSSTSSRRSAARRTSRRASARA
ncbi:MAG: sigma 54-interacting transcriptional regulator [Polyangiales bacterium]